MYSNQQIIDKIYNSYAKNSHKVSNFLQKDLEYMWNNNFIQLNQDLGSFFNNLDKNIKILDLACGPGNFSFFCKKKGFKNYTGVDLSKEEIELNKKYFGKYSFYNQNVFDFLKDNDEKYDLIFSSHFFEHLSLGEGYYLIELIDKNLNLGGIWINIMPNSDAYFHSFSGLNIDLTHKQLYTPNSFEVLLKQFNFREIKHFNMTIGKNKFQQIIHKFYKKIFDINLSLLGYCKKEIYTPNFITIIKK